MEKAPRRSWQYTTLYKKKLDAQKGSKISTNGGWSRLDRLRKKCSKMLGKFKWISSQGLIYTKDGKQKKLHKTMEKQ